MPKTKVISGTEIVKIRITTATKERLQQDAEANYRTFQDQVRMVLDQWMIMNYSHNTMADKENPAIAEQKAHFPCRPPLQI